ncbi:MAG TPA: hypothetical protein VGP07_09345 [Polyangia bacterium]|jgi:hypothetical protein
MSHVVPGRSSHHWGAGAILGIYALAAVVGYFVGARSVLPFGPWSDRAASTSLARIGFALREQNVKASPEAWEALRADADTVRATWNPQQRDVFDLVVAVRGLERGGEPDWSRAEQVCRALKWPRCDRVALEELRRRSRP